jgi:DNA-binding NtrC family response regulator
MVGESVAMQRLRLQVSRIGPHFRTVLVTGEAGTGKELAARALHRASPAANGPFVVCTGAALEDALENGATDDAVASLVQMARGGSLFIHEIGEIPLDAQGRLLRVLRQQERLRDSSTLPQTADVRTDLRLIASTSHDLRVMASSGRFKQELYHRVATVEVALAPLRERAEDIPVLAMHFLHRFACLHVKCVERITDHAMEKLTLHLWPGNIREMENILKSWVLQSDGEVLEASTLPPFARMNPEAASPEASGLLLQEVVERHVLHVLKSCGGNKLRTAEALGISRSTLYRMLEARPEIMDR